jgi:GMP synthase (glutamine-hydrolysing)
MRRWIVLQHVSWEGPGAIAIEAHARDIALTVHRLDLTPCVPAPEDADVLIVMGGPMGVYESSKYPYLASEGTLIAEMVRRGRPVLCVCLGAQLLANALGARVYGGPSPEIGFGDVDLTIEAKRDPLFENLPDPLPVFHWHADTFDLPDGAHLLARNSHYKHQAFSFGSNAYGLQFHIEADLDTWKGWQAHLPWHAMADGERHFSRVAKVGQILISRFFEIAQNIEA